MSLQVLTKSSSSQRSFGGSRLAGILGTRRASTLAERQVEYPACISATIEGSDSSNGYSSESAAFQNRLKYLRNFGISAHIDSGKTTLTERVLFYTGRIKAIHEVKGKDGVGAKMDFMELEREKGITIQSAATHTKWNNFGFNLIDTPGHVDFTIEVERALKVLDGAVMVLCGVSGVQSQSITVDRQMKRYDVPRLTFINKLDRRGANPWRIVEQIRNKLRNNCAATQIPIGLEDDHEGVVDLITREAIYFEGAHGHILRTAECPPELVDQMESKRIELIEKLADVDDYIGDKYLEEARISEKDLYEAIRKTTVARTFTPVLLGSALKNKGVQPLLDGVCAYLPSPAESQNYALKPAADGIGEEKLLVKTDDREPTIALAFKLEDKKFGQLTYVRVYQGSISKGDVLLNTRNDKKIKIPRLVRTNAEDMEDLKRAGAGEICALFGVDCASGDTFTNATQASKLAMESLHVPEPVISLAVKPVKSDSGSFSKAIGRFTREDPTFRFEVDQDTGDRVMSGMGELHLEIYVERMKREYDCPVETGKPRVNYKENILQKARFEHLLKKQTGGSGQYAGVMGFIEPVGDGSRENIFDNRCTGTNIPSQFYSAIEKGFQEGLKEGPLAGCAIEGVRFVLLDGKAHLVDSSELAFKAATKHAFKEAFLKAAPSLLEPIMNLQVQIPGEFQGQVIGALSKRRGVVMNSTSIDENIVMDMEVPLGDMFGFSTELRSLTQGKGEFAMEYLEHRGAPRNTVARVAEEHQQRKEELKKN